LDPQGIPERQDTLVARVPLVQRECQDQTAVMETRENKDLAGLLDLP